MITIPAYFVVITILVLGTVIFVTGWNLAVHKWREGRTKLMANVERLEGQVHEFNEQRQKDPQRGWTDVGTQYALTRMENTIAAIREQIEGRKDRD